MDRHCQEAAEFNELGCAVGLDFVAYYRDRRWCLHRCPDRQRIKAARTSNQETADHLCWWAYYGLWCSALRWLQYHAHLERRTTAVFGFDPGRHFDHPRRLAGFLLHVRTADESR